MKDERRTEILDGDEDPNEYECMEADLSGLLLNYGIVDMEESAIYTRYTILLDGRTHYLTLSSKPDHPKEVA